MKTGFIGGGKMAEAIVMSLLKHGTLDACDVLASDISAERRRHLNRKYRIRTVADNLELVAAVRVIWLAVKPQDLPQVSMGIASEVGREHLIISIAAGKRLATIEELLPRARVVRVMPNLPCRVSEGMSAFCLGTRTTASDRRIVVRQLSAFGAALELPEEQFDAVTALSGSGPAFFAYVLDALVDSAEKQGLQRDHALLLAEQTMYGTAKLLKEQKIAPQDLIESVASAKGTTAAGLSVLDESTIRAVLHRTLAAAARRSRELSAG